MNNPNFKKFIKPATIAEESIQMLLYHRNAFPHKEFFNFNKSLRDLDLLM